MLGARVRDRSVTEVLVNTLVQGVHCFAKVFGAEVGQGAPEGRLGIRRVKRDLCWWSRAEELLEALKVVLSVNRGQR